MPEILRNQLVNVQVQSCSEHLERSLRIWWPSVALRAAAAGHEEITHLRNTLRETAPTRCLRSRICSRVVMSYEQKSAKEPKKASLQTWRSSRPSVKVAVEGRLVAICLPVARSAFP